jgi:hypothetical protein
MNEKNEIEKFKEDIFLNQQKLLEKENMFLNVLRENEKLIKGNLKVREIFITEPTRLNNELNNEVNDARDIMSKISKLMNAEKRKNEKLEKINCEKTAEINLLNKKLLENMEFNTEATIKIKGNSEKKILKIPENDSEKKIKNENNDEKDNNDNEEKNINDKSNSKLNHEFSYINFF